MDSLFQEIILNMNRPKSLYPLHFVVVVRLVWSCDPESYASGSITARTTSMPKRSRVMDLQAGGRERGPLHIPVKFALGPNPLRKYRGKKDERERVSA
jgi:hypothetical protein